MREGLKKIALAVAIGSISTGVLAEVDGTIGTTSTGNFDITYIKGSIARIWGLADFTMTDSDLVAAPNTNEICVFSNKGAGSNTYEMKVSSSNGFQLTDATGGGASPISYNLKVEGIGDGGGSIDNSSLTPGTDLEFAGDLTAGFLLDQPRPNLDCTTDKNAKISIWFSSAPNIAVGTYSDTVTMLVTPK